jgi:hypothetical protein
MLAKTIQSWSKMMMHHRDGITVSTETLWVIVMHNGEGKCCHEQNYLRETVEEKGRDISTFDEFAPALVDGFFLSYYF